MNTNTLNSQSQAIFEAPSTYLNDNASLLTAKVNEIKRAEDGKACSGTGKYHSEESEYPKPYSTISLSDIQALVDDPEITDKSAARWIIPSNLLTRSHDQQYLEGQFHYLWADLDENTLSAKEIGSLISGIIGHVDYEIYSSKSATESVKKCRVLIKVTPILDGTTWALCQEILGTKLAAIDIIPDIAAYGTGQLCYLPNRGEFYESDSMRQGKYFNPLSLWEGDIAEKKQLLAAEECAIQAANYEYAKRRAELNSSGTLSIFKMFNESYSIAQILLMSGYKQRGNKFCSPRSVSGSYSGSVKNIEGVSRYHTLSTSDQLFVQDCSHDAFSVFTVLMHNNDKQAAIKDAGFNLLEIDGEPFHTVAQRIWKENQNNASAKVVAEEAFEITEQPDHAQLSKKIFALDYPKGLVGDVAKYIYSSSRKPSMSFSIAGALVAVSHISMGKYYVSSSNTGLNVYFILCGDTSCGKESPRQGIKAILTAIEATDSIDEAMASGPALLKALSSRVNNNAFIMSDEFGLFIQGYTSKNGSQHTKDFFREILSIYSMSRSFYGGKTYADSKNSIAGFQKPFLNILGTTTLSTLMKGITMDTVRDGTLNRFLYVEANEHAKTNRSQVWTVPDNLIKSLKMLGSLSPSDDDVAMHIEPDASAILINKSDYLEKKGDFAPLWGRYEENVLKIAALISLPKVVITKESIKWAIEYVEFSINSLEVKLESELAGSYFQTQVNLALNFIKNPRKYTDKKFDSYLQKGWMPKSKLLKLMKCKSSELNDIQTWLVDTQEIKVDTQNNITLLAVA